MGSVSSRYPHDTAMRVLLSAACVVHEQNEAKPSSLDQCDERPGGGMIFITLARWRKKSTKECIAQSSKFVERMVKEGAKVLGMYWMLGRCDAILITEAKDEKAGMKALLRWGDLVSTETLVAVTREEALKLLE